MKNLTELTPEETAKMCIRGVSVLVAAIAVQHTDRVMAGSNKRQLFIIADEVEKYITEGIAE